MIFTCGVCCLPSNTLTKPASLTTSLRQPPRAVGPHTVPVLYTAHCRCGDVLRCGPASPLPDTCPKQLTTWAVASRTESTARARAPCIPVLAVPRPWTILRHMKIQKGSALLLYLMFWLSKLRIAFLIL